MIPNIITMIRLLTTIPLFLIIIKYGVNSIFPFILFLLIVLTDFLDGYIARKYHMITKFGKVLDPIVDKVLIITTTIALLIKGIIPVYSLLIYVRDIIINIGAIIVMKKERLVLSSNVYGKIKTVLHFVAICLVLLLGKWNYYSLILLIISFLTLIPEGIFAYNLYLRKDKYERILNKKEQKKELSYKELDMFFTGYLDDKINDDLMSKMLKVICKNELTNKEIINLTDIFINSGDKLDLSKLGMTIDKHSTGGIGDKTTLILGPIVAACGIKMPKMSGRALGYTGGTIDKLESIGMKVDLSEQEFIDQVKEIGFAVTSQTKNLCPMDKKVYALRDITETTESIGLIASSIMSKKIASGASKILIDLKVGNGALIKNIKDAEKLANIMIQIGKNYNREVRCMLTKMDNPLGDNIGNSIEILEVVDILKNKKNNSLTKLVIEMSSQIVSMGKNISLEKAKKEVTMVLESGQAYNKFLEFVKYQKGNIDNIIIDDKKEIKSRKDGYISKIDALEIGKLSMALGAGRINKNDKINYNAGVILNKNIGDKVNKGDILCSLYGNKNINISNIEDIFTIKNIKKSQDDLLIKIIM